jgi:hypothetical protein
MRATNRRAAAVALALELEREQRRFFRTMTAALAAFLGGWTLLAMGLR